MNATDDFARDDKISIIRPTSLMIPTNCATVPALFAEAGENGRRRYVEFFIANIRNPNTRAAYARAANRFSEWCERLGLDLAGLEPAHVAVYVEQLGTEASAPTVKQHLAALRMLFDYLVTGQVIAANPAGPVRGPRHSAERGKSPVLSAEEARLLIDSIDVTKLAGLRDRALIGAMVYSFARVSAVLGMNAGDYYRQGEFRWLRLKEKGGKHHEVPAHHKVVEYLGAYLEAAGIGENEAGPLFRSVGRSRDSLTERRLHRREALAMVKRRAEACGLGGRLCCHSFRATGITVYLECGGTLEKAQRIAAHSSPRTTKLYDRTADVIERGEIERIFI